VSNRTVLRWVQTFGPQLAAEARKHRRPLGRTWYLDEMFFFRGKDKWYLYRAVDEHGQVVDVLLREHRDTASAKAFFEQELGRSGQAPSTIITDHHQPYIKAIHRVVPTALHIRSGLHRATGVTTKPIERSHVPTRDRLRAWVEDAAYWAALPGRASSVCARCGADTSDWQTYCRRIRSRPARRITCEQWLLPCSCWASASAGRLGHVGGRRQPAGTGCSLAGGRPTESAPGPTARAYTSQRRKLRSPATWPPSTRC
jgi:DDE domain